MKKLIALIGSITLTTSVGAVFVVSCGMRTYVVNFNIDGVENVDKVQGNPKDIMLKLLEFLTFSNKKYTNDEKRKQALEALSEKALTMNLYNLSSKENNSGEDNNISEFNSRLTSINNDGIKSLSFTGEENMTKASYKNLNFTVVTEEYYTDKEEQHSLPPESKAYAEGFDEILKDEKIWVNDKDDASKKKFTEFYEGLGDFNVLGTWTSPTQTDGGIKIVPLKDKDTTKEYQREFKEEFALDYFEKTYEPDFKRYALDAFQRSTTAQFNVNIKLKYGDLAGRHDDDLEVDLTAKNLRTIMEPKFHVVSDVKPAGDVKLGKRTTIFTWLPVAYTFTNSFKDWIEKKNIFKDVEVSLDTVAEAKK